MIKAKSGELGTTLSRCVRCVGVRPGLISLALIFKKSVLRGAWNGRVHALLILRDLEG